MERELEKTLMEIEHLIKDHARRGNTHTQSVLQIAHEVIEPCAKVARTLPDLKEMLERDMAENITEEEFHGVKFYSCPICNEPVHEKDNFCCKCGQRLKKEK